MIEQCRADRRWRGRNRGGGSVDSFVRFLIKLKSQNWPSRGGDSSINSSTALKLSPKCIVESWVYIKPV